MASLYRRNGVWYVALVVDGRRVYKSTVTTAKTSDGAVTGGKVATGQVVKSINALKDCTMY